MESESEDPGPHALVEAAASAVAVQYVEIIPLPAFGLVFDAFYDGGAGASQFAPLYELFRTREEIDERSGNALEDPHITVGEEGQALFAYIDEHDAWGLVDEYFDALRGELSRRLGIRVASGSSEGELRYRVIND